MASLLVTDVTLTSLIKTITGLASFTDLIVTILKEKKN